jgi:ribonucleoside-diphosphate reductase alpha chain
VPLKSYVKTLSNMSFAPQGMTDDPEIRTASSLIDYIFRRLAQDYLSFDDRLELGLASFDDLEKEQASNQPTLLTVEATPAPVQESPKAEAKTQSVSQPKTVATKKMSMPSGSSPMCTACGNMTQRAGSCYICTACGSTSGCS